MAKDSKSPADFIKLLDMNGLAGRMAYLPGPKGKNTELLFIYGQHSSLERWWGLLQFANRYGTVTAPDLPGFGGMESFYKLGKKPTIDNYADYLAAFIKMCYKRKKVTIIGLSMGFVITTRMLQRYPELKKHVRLLVSLVGFAHADDFAFPRPRYWFYRTIATVFSNRALAFLFRCLFLNSLMIRATYDRTYQAKAKFAAAKTPEEHKRFMDMEVSLWQRNDPSTHAYTLKELLTLDNCTRRVDVPVWHVDVAGDQYLDNHRVEQHLRVVFEEVHIVRSNLTSHAPSVIMDEAAAAPLMPKPLRRILAKLQ